MSQLLFLTNQFHKINKKLRYREEDTASVVLSYFNALAGGDPLRISP